MNCPWTKRTTTVFLLLFLLGCEVDASKPLGDGYLHAETNLYNTWVVHGGDTVVDSNVTHALSVDDYIVGLRIEPEEFVSHSVGEISSEYGYFVYDKSTESLIEGLSEAEMKRIFSDNGWNYTDLLEATL